MLSENTTNQLRTAAWLMLGVAAIVGVYQYGRAINHDYPGRTFSVEGTADIETPQNLGVFTATVTTEGQQEAGPLQEQNTQKMNAMIAAFKEKGIEAKDLKTLNYNVNPRYDTVACAPGSTCPPPKISGYSVTQSLEVRVRALDQVGTLLALATEKGATSVSNINFVPDESDEAKAPARAEAFQKAQDKAKAMASAGHFRLGRLVTLYEDDGSQPMPFAERSFALDASAKQGNTPPTIEPGTNPGKLTVVLTYEIR